MMITFQVVKFKGKRKENGKWRQKTFTQTINPFNKNEDGTVKNYFEVQKSVKKEAKEWENEFIK